MPKGYTAAAFEQFAEFEARGYTPLYYHLAKGTAGDPDVLAVAEAVDHRPVTVLFMAAIQYLLFEESTHDLAGYYPSLSDSPAPPDEAFPLFRSFVLDRRNEIERLGATRYVQTNEVGRSALFLPAFLRLRSEPLALIEIGTSAGLNLRYDRYGYRYGHTTLGRPGASPVIECEVRGEGMPLPRRIPRAGLRLGIDLHPLDAGDPEDLRWLDALIWPEHVERRERLLQASRAAAAVPADLRKGDVLDLLPSLLDEVPAESEPVVFHSFALNQMDREARRQIVRIIEASGRPVSVLSMEYPTVLEPFGVAAERSADERPVLAMTRIEGEVKEAAVLARCQPHGAWIEWVEGQARP